MSTSPLVSILMTVYNREKYISEAVESVLSQNYENWELLIVDDCSSDSSLEIANNYKALDTRINIYKNKVNLGQFENRNYAASLAKGKYIKYLDSDDLLYPYALTAMVEAIEKYPEAGAAISHNQLHEKKPYPIYLTSEEAHFAFYFNDGFPCSGPSAAIINREVFNKVKGFPKPYYVGTDLLLWLEIATISGIVKIPPALNWYRVHEGQALSAGIQSNEYLKKDYNYLMQFLKRKDCKLNNDDKAFAEKALKKRQIRNLLSLVLKKGRFYTSYKIMKYNNLKLTDITKAL